MSRIGAILLAAGESRRMGAVDKRTLPVGGVPLLRRSVLTLLASRLDQVVVVLGHRAEEIRPLLAGLDVDIVFNPDYAQGQMTSVHCGLEAMAEDYDGVMVCLADQPLLTPADINALIEAFDRRQQGSILVPTHGGRRGNPIVLAHAHRHEILGGGRNLGCRRLIERNPELVATVEMADDHVVFDLDTPEDYQALQRRLAPQGGAAPA